MDKDNSTRIEKQLNTVIELLQRLVAMELANAGANHTTIGKQLRVAKAKVGFMLSGIKKAGGQ